MKEISLKEKKKRSFKLPLIILGVMIAIILMSVFAFQSVQNKAISYDEQIQTAKAEIKVQEKRRSDLIPNLVDCVKQYDEYEYKTLMEVVESRGTNSDESIGEIQTMVSAVAESYPELKSNENYKELMNELSTTENLIANTRTSYNDWVNKYTRYIRHFPNAQILRLLGYKTVEYNRLDFDVSEDAHTDLFE